MTDRIKDTIHIILMLEGLDGISVRDADGLDSGNWADERGYGFRLVRKGDGSFRMDGVRR
jgi:hypothetical protein